MNMNFESSFHQPPQLSEGVRRRGCRKHPGRLRRRQLQQHRCIRRRFRCSGCTTGRHHRLRFSWETANRELETWNFLYSQSASDLNVTTNMWDGLLSFDCYGKVAPAIAKSWEHNDDSTVWTFHLRDDVDWVRRQRRGEEPPDQQGLPGGPGVVLNAFKNEAFQHLHALRDCGGRCRLLST